MARQKPIEIFMPPNVLKTKVGSMALPTEDTFRGAVKALAELKNDYAKWLEEEVGRLLTAREQLLRAPGATDARDTLKRVAADLKNQAQNCDFPIVARVAQSLCTLIEKVGKSPTISAKLLNAHVDAISLMIRDGIKDASNPVSKALASELEDRVAVYAPD